jgi:DNA polymerase-3 subunit epsilon
VLLAAIEVSGLTLEEWTTRVKQPIAFHSGSSNGIVQAGRPEGVLFGETLVFTGSLRMLRREAAAIASQLGCDVAASVTTKTTILVVGQQDKQKVGHSGLSSKHQKALALRSAGHEIAILTENDFVSLLDQVAD